MPQEDGFLTHLLIETGLKHKYNQLKWWWIWVSVACGIFAALLGWLYARQLTIQFAFLGTILGAGVFAIFLKIMAKRRKTNL